MKLIIFCVFTFCMMGHISTAQEPSMISKLDLEKLPASQGVFNFWVQTSYNGMAQPVLVPVIVVKGARPGPVLGITAGIHGNELNGIGVIHRLLEQINPAQLAGTIVAVPGLNVPGILDNDRRFPDGEDLNRVFPGSADGDESQQYVFHAFEKIIYCFDYLIDLHTASFGRINALYVRADLALDTLAQMAALQPADIILNSKGAPSFGADQSTALTLRAYAAQHGIPSLTIELGDPQVFQPDMIRRGAQGVHNALCYLNMLDQKPEAPEIKPVYCKKSYWMYTGKGGLLEVTVQPGQQVQKGELIARLRNPFGELLDTYTAPESGIVIGAGSNPVCPSGGRIIHLGILQ